MPRVLRIINRLNLGGPTYNATYLTKYLGPDYETLLVAGTTDETEASSMFIPEKLGIKPVLIPEMKREINFSDDRAAYHKIRKLIHDFKPDIVHTHASKAGALGRLAALKEGVPVILHTFHGHVFHSYFNPIKTRVFIQIERYLAKRTSGIIAISELQKRELGEEFKICDPGNIHVIPLGFDLDRFAKDQETKRQLFRNTYLLADDEIAIGIIGRLVPVKNHSLFLEASMKVLAKTNQKLRFFIIGDGELMERIKKEAEELNIPYCTHDNLSERSPLTFTSWIRDIDVATAGLDIVALTSLNEGTPVSLIEAQAAGKPIVSTRVGGISDVVVEGRTALLSKREDASAFADNLLLLTENKELRIAMSHKGREMVMEKFSYQRLVRDVDQLYKDILTRLS